MIGTKQESHPSGETLAAFALGHLEDDAAAKVADHLGVCETCQQAVLAVPNDSMLSLLRPGDRTPLPQPQLLGETSFEDALPPELREHSRYQVLRRLGAGGMGVVYQCQHRLMGRTVALKVINKKLIGSPELVERFQREVRAAALLAHPNVVQAFDAEKAGDLHFLVLEFIDGITLETLVKRDGPLPVERACDCVRQAALGLAHAATQGLVHRDVKPQNIMVSPQGQVKVMDFGLASISAERGGEGGLTEPGQGMGTPDYMAPEQIRDAHTADARADLYSLGCTLYFLLTGRPPFPKGNAAQKMAAHLEQQPDRLPALRPELAAGLVQVIDKMMAKDPAQRYQTAAAVVAALEPWCHEARGQILPRTVASQAEPGLQSPRKRIHLAVAAGLLVLIGVAISLVIVACLARPTPKEAKHKEDSRLKEDPQVLTVSKRPEDGGRFPTIQAALDAVEPGMTIRVLDDSDYEEYLLINRPEEQRDVVLEATGQATIRKVAGKHEMVWIRGVPGFSVRGFRFESGQEGHAQIFITGSSPGVILDRLDMKSGYDCVGLRDVPLSGKDVPIVIQNCTMRAVSGSAVVMRGYEGENPDCPQPCGNVVIRNNTLAGCEVGVDLRVAVSRVHIVGNRILDTKWGAIDLRDFLPGTADVLVANNTLLRNQVALRVWDDSTKAKDFLKSKNIRFQNNLLLEPQFPVDLVFKDHPRGIWYKDRPGDLEALLNSPQWRFSHNWREIDPVKAVRADPAGSWVPARPNDRLQVRIEVLSRKSGSPNFLRPARNSPLGTAGAGARGNALAALVSAVGMAPGGATALLVAWTAADAALFEPALPPYVGAVPPEGSEPWDWDKTWKVLVGGEVPAKVPR